MLALQILGGLLAVIIVYLVVIIFFPVLKVEPQPTKRIDISNKEIPKNRENISFDVHGTKVSGWFYKPEGEKKQYPCIVMSHGFGGTKDMSLEQYALKFAKAGYATLTYDYRYYGESGGEPRQVYCAIYQIDDLKGAVEYVTSREDVEKIVLWGTSAGAAYGINIASFNHDITAVIAQCGAFDHKEDNKLYMDREGFGFFLKLFMHGQRDKGRSRFGLSPHVFPAYGKPGTIAMLTAPGAFEGIEELAKESVTFKNEACGRLALLPHMEDPIKLAVNVECPVQVMVCTKDDLVSPKSHVRLVEALNNPEVREYPIGHFDIYHGEHFEKATDDMIDFLSKLNL